MSSLAAKSATRNTSEKNAKGILERPSLCLAVSQSQRAMTFTYSILRIYVAYKLDIFVGIIVEFYTLNIMTISLYHGSLWQRRAYANYTVCVLPELDVLVRKCHPPQWWCRIFTHPQVAHSWSKASPRSHMILQDTLTFS